MDLSRDAGLLVSGVDGMPLNPIARSLNENDSASHDAALLLMNVKHIALSEVEKTPRSVKIIACPVVTPVTPLKATQCRADLIVASCESQLGSIVASNRTRFRTVSVDQLSSLVPSSSSYESDSGEETILRYVWNSGAIPVSPCQKPLVRKKNFVGTTSQASLRGILRKKYAWREFPELEEYLVENRERYLSFSSQRNYTAEQKRFNNRLTQGLLDLASESGYLFQGFTFAMIRDRIRCYYKSYVQAIKKKHKKRY